MKVLDFIETWQIRTLVYCIDLALGIHFIIFFVCIILYGGLTINEPNTVIAIIELGFFCFQVIAKLLRLIKLAWYNN